MALLGLTAADLVPTSRSSKATPSGRRATVAIKYRDGDGNQWTGRGLKPKCRTFAISQGKRQEDFLI
jgi:DNA-binding protein H-NS